MIKKFNFDNTDMPSWLFINKLRRPAFQSNEPRTLEVEGRRGVYYIGKKTKEKQIEIDITVMANNDNDLQLKIEWLSGWLDREGEFPLRFNDEPDRYYMAAFIGGSDELDAIAAMGSTTLTFFCADPYKFGPHHNYDFVVNEQPFTIANQGTAPLYPYYTATFRKASAFFSLVTADGFIQLGQAQEVEEVVIPELETVLADPMNDLAPWTSSGINVDFGEVRGTMYVNDNHRFMVNDFAADESVYTKWFGPVLKRSLPSAVKDFRVSFEVELYANEKQTGRVELWLLNAAGAIVARLIVYDKYDNTSLVSASVTAGSYSSNTEVLHNNGPEKGIWNNFRGRIVLRRDGSTWRTTVAQMDSLGRERMETLSTRVIQHSGNLDNVAQVQIGMRKYGRTLPASMTIRDIKVERINKPQEQNKEVPGLFKAGDVLQVDYTTGSTWKNGEYYNMHLDPASQFKPITPGTTEVLALTSQPNSVNVNVDYDERYK